MKNYKFDNRYIILIPALALLQLGCAQAPKTLEPSVSSKNAEKAANEIPRNHEIVRIISYGDAEAEFVLFDSASGVKSENKTYKVKVAETGALKEAFVERVIEVISINHPREFLWHSSRINRDVILSTKIQDRYATKNFLLKDFFPQKP